MRDRIASFVRNYGFCSAALATGKPPAAAPQTAVRPSVGRRAIGRDEERTNDILPMKPNWPREFCMKSDIKTNKPLFIRRIYPMIFFSPFSPLFNAFKK